MKTKEEVIAYLRSELLNNNTITFSTRGQGGSGLNLMISHDGEQIDDFCKELLSYEFDGLIDPSADIYESPYFCADVETYQFSDKNGFLLEVMVER